VLVRSLGNDETLYAVNAHKLLMPASNMKIVTLAAAAERLGWDYQFETTIVARGPIADGALAGDLVVIGSGDPSLTSLDGRADRVFGEWAERLKQLGVRAVAGEVIAGEPAGEAGAEEDRTLGFGWSWDDLPDAYAAGVGTLQFNENMVRVTITPGPAVGDTAGVGVAPAGSGLTIVNSVSTSAADGASSIGARRFPGSPRLELRGAVRLGSAPTVLSVSVDDPALFFVTALRAALIADGIDIRGPSVTERATGRPASPQASSPVTPVATYRSPPLSALALRLMKNSQNQYAETLLKAVGAAAGPRTADSGRAAAQATLAAWGVPDGEVIQRDGSGLSRYDYVTPAAIVAILTHVDRIERLRGPFEAALPVAGRDGSLADRMKGTPAEGNARAKTGSMSNVRALSGYVTAADGEPLVFAIIANNFEVSADLAVKAIDAIVGRLARFRR
jgi:D-alanyl-D-alanine carboxypeptidase/D-alanyl-D-alanine-endopeptidase (penicillin-binding protein 4)